MSTSKPSPPEELASSLPDWIDDGDYIEMDLSDPAVQAKYDEFVRRRNYLLAPIEAKVIPASCRLLPGEDPAPCEMPLLHKYI